MSTPYSKENLPKQLFINNEVSTNALVNLIVRQLKQR